MKGNKIKKIKAREILDSRGDPTLEVLIFTDKFISRASVPSGASRGEEEAKELRDGGKRYFGKGVKKAVKIVGDFISKKLKGMKLTDQEKIDNVLIELDGTKDKRKLGANTILGVSIASAKGGAKSLNLPFYKYIAFLYGNKKRLKIPISAFNIINGGLHAGNELSIQEFMIVPQTKSFKKNLQIASEIYHSLKEILIKTFGKEAVNLGDEGGFSPPLTRTERGLELLEKATKEAGYKKWVKFSLDCAASYFWTGKDYNLEGKIFTSEGLISFYENLIKRFPILSIEDPFSEKDFDGFGKFTKKFKRKIIIFGDDLTVTLAEKIKLAKEKKLCTGVIIKPNQIGTLTETFQAIKIAREGKMKIMVSHRSGETTDTFISDLAVGVGAEFLKAGAPARGERVVKYNRLLEIEEEIYGKG